MNSAVPHDRELFRLLWSVCDGTSNPAECERLEQLVLEDAAVARSYVLFQSIHADLLWNNQAEGADRDLPIERVAAPSGTQRSYARLFASLVRHVPGGEFTVGTLIVVAVVAAFWGLSQAILHPKLGGWKLAAKPEIRASRSEAVATIREVVDAEWSVEETEIPDRKSTIAAGQPLSIQSGLVELELKQGTKLVIEGPAEWSIDGENQATLSHGKLVAKVPSEAIGFTLQTPTAKIVDLGTEFGVDVGETGITRVAVGSGVVECSVPKSSQLPTRLRKGEALRVSSDGNVTRVPYDSANFVGLATKSSNQPLSEVPYDPALWVYEPFTETRDGAAIHHRHEGFGFRVIQWVASEAVGGDGLPVFCIRSDFHRGTEYFPRNVHFQGTPGVFEHRATQWGLGRATRKMARSVNLAQDGEYFLSFVGFKYRVNSRGMVGLFSREAGQGIEAGWNCSGNGDDDPFALASPGQLKKAVAPESRIGGNAETVFFVVRIVASAEKPDAVYLKAYRSTDTVHASPDLLQGEGPGPDQWSVVLPEFRSDLNLDQLTLGVDGPEAYIHIDEIRLGTTWQAVTGVVNE